MPDPEVLLTSTVPAVTVVPASYVLLPVIFSVPPRSFFRLPPVPLMVPDIVLKPLLSTFKTRAPVPKLTSPVSVKAFEPVRPIWLLLAEKAIGLPTLRAPPLAANFGALTLPTVIVPVPTGPDVGALAGPTESTANSIVPSFN